MNTTQKNPSGALATERLLQQHNLAAMVLEVSAPKAGNVHKHASFDDVTWQDFIASAMVTSPILARANQLGVGRCVLECVRATQQTAGSNTNLGMLLLMAPLSAAFASSSDFKPAMVQHVLDELDGDDARDVFEAIALANPGGLGNADKGDVTQHDQANSPIGLCEAMGLAAERDTIAKQYVNGFMDVFELADQLAVLLADASHTLDQAIVLAYLQLMASTPDTLIARKVGKATAVESADRARLVLAAHWPVGENSQEEYTSFDRWLRADGHRRNPGTSADMVAAALLVVLGRSQLQLPHAWGEDLWS